ncbi:hypothetical protein LVD17_07360 [Fulvivirga ulvae]|uniref:hypothetical protein n=1 Tax=Fulvivirga ulvae TaxID=2904245 RepID=UPI001F3619B1|nr:hypothetical protein [Fulvivirga ulvae]UII33636.1 hypothetical protein LVD17_07360 [Fulvivirga ulvae]
MVKLTDISISSGSSNPKALTFNREVRCVEDLFLSNFSPVTTTGVKKINVGIYDYNLDSHKLEKYKVPVNQSQLLIDIAHVNHYFDFDKYLKEPAEKRKRIVLDLLFQSCLKVCQAENLDTINFKSAYDACLTQGLKNAFYNKEKAWNRNRSLYVNLKIVFEIDYFLGIVEVCNKEGTQLLEKELFKVSPVMVQHPFFNKVKWLSLNKFRISPKSFFNQLTDDEFWDIEVKV